MKAASALNFSNHISVSLRCALGVPVAGVVQLQEDPLQMISASVGRCAPAERQCLSLVLPTVEQVMEDPHFEIMVTKHDEASQRPQFAPLPVLLVLLPF